MSSADARAMIHRRLGSGMSTTGISLGPTIVELADALEPPLR
jgi:hypothetical protein